MLNKSNSSTTKILFACSSLIILTIACTTLLNATLLVFNLKIYAASLIIGFIISTLILLKSKKFVTKEVFSSIFIFLIVICVSFFISINTYDVSWDGQWYHQDAILKLYNGWNPFYSNAITNYVLIDSDMWIQHYPQASWYLQASILDLTEKIQGAKSINIILIINLLMLSYYTLVNYIKLKSRLVSIIISICIALNPVACYQLNSFYVDGQSAMLLSSYILLLIILYKEKSLLTYLLIASLIIYTCNIKFTNLIYVSIISLSYYLLDLFTNKKLNYKLSAYFISIFIVTVFYVGYGSYGRNIIEKGHPFYPLLGKNSYGNIVADVNKSANFINNNRFENFILSTFSYPKYSRQPNNSELRIPFTKTEYFQYSRTDSEIAGFGAIYSDLLLIIIILITIPLIYYLKKYKEYYPLIVLIITIISTVIIIPEMFVARYIPQFWLVPIILLLMAYIRYNSIFKGITLITFLALILNSYFILERQYKHQQEVKFSIDQELAYLKTLKQPIQLRNRYLSIDRRLYENNIKFKNDRFNESPDRKEFVYTFYENYYFVK